MKCIDCDKTFLYPVVERGKDTAMCPLCFGSNLDDVQHEELEFARTQRWYFDKPKELRVTTVVVPDDLYERGSWWIGYVAEEGEKFRLMYVGTEAEADRRIEEYKLSGGKLRIQLRLGGAEPTYEERQVIYAAKLKAEEAYHTVPKASEVI